MSVGGLYENCLKGGSLNGEPSGKMEGGAYFARAPATETQEATNRICVILLTDVFGISLKNSRIIADEMAKKTGWDVWIPDMFNGTLQKTLQLHLLS